MPPLATAAGNWKDVVPALTVTCVPATSRSVRPNPVRPVTVPPMRNERVVQVIVTFVTFAFGIVPEPKPTTQSCVGPAGCVCTVTVYAAPLARPPPNVNAPFEPTARSLPPFKRSTRPAPASPAAMPPTVNVPGGGGEPPPSPLPLHAATDIIMAL